MRLRARLRLTRQPDGTSPWWGIAILLGGVALVLLGWLWEGTWEDVFIEVGAAAGVGGIVLLFKPRLMRQVDQVATEAATTTATTITASATDDIEERLVRLESVGDIQAQEMQRRQAETERVVEAVANEASFESVAEMLNLAYDKRLFKRRVFIKTGDQLGQPLFAVSGSVSPEDQEVFDTRRCSLSIYHLEVTRYEREQFDEVQGGTISWSAGTDIRRTVGEILNTYERLNLPYDTLSLQTFFNHLQESYESMVAARSAPQDSHKRLKGRLIFYINEEWTLTEEGLESTQSDRVFEYGYSEYGEWVVDGVSDSQCPPGHTAHLWDEAQFYMRTFINIETPQY